MDRGKTVKMEIFEMMVDTVKVVVFDVDKGHFLVDYYR